MALIEFYITYLCQGRNETTHILLLAFKIIIRKCLYLGAVEVQMKAYLLIEYVIANSHGPFY